MCEIVSYGDIDVFSRQRSIKFTRNVRHVFGFGTRTLLFQDFSPGLNDRDDNIIFNAAPIQTQQI